MHGHGHGHDRARRTATRLRVALLVALALAGCRSESAAPAAPAPATPAAPAVDNGDTEVTIPVEGMVCGGCEQAIGAALGKLPGVSSVAASHTEKRVVVRFDSARVTRAQLEAAITGLGYVVPPPSLPLDAPAESPAPAP